MPELVHSKLPAAQAQRVTRLMMDFLRLREELTWVQVRTVYKELETVRDGISKLLDKVDGKDA
jgi:transcriptional regulator NrdR family protein